MRILFVYLLMLCVAMLLLLLELLLHAAAVRHRVPDRKICCYGSLHLIKVFSSSSSKHDIFLMHALAVLSQLQPRFTYNTYHTSSVVTGIRGAKEGVSPPGRSLYIYICRGSLMRGESCRSTAGCDKNKAAFTC